MRVTCRRGCLSFPVATATATATAAGVAMAVLVVGWILVDQGLRFPGEQYAAISLSVDAHDPMVAAGNMTMMLLGAFFLEMVGGAAIFGAASGSGRAPGKPTFPPLWLHAIIYLVPRTPVPGTRYSIYSCFLSCYCCIPGIDVCRRTCRCRRV